MNTAALIAELRSEAVRRGYRFEETREGSSIVVRMYRSDGSLAMTATHHEDAAVQPREVQ